MFANRYANQNRVHFAVSQTVCAMIGGDFSLVREYITQRMILTHPNLTYVRPMYKIRLKVGIGKTWMDKLRYVWVISYNYFEEQRYQFGIPMPVSNAKNSLECQLLPTLTYQHSEVPADSPISCWTSFTSFPLTPLTKLPSCALFLAASSSSFSRWSSLALISTASFNSEYLATEKGSNYLSKHGHFYYTSVIPLERWQWLAGNSNIIVTCINKKMSGG